MDNLTPFERETTLTVRPALDYDIAGGEDGFSVCVWPLRGRVLVAYYHHNDADLNFCLVMPPEEFCERLLAKRGIH